jgi:hypothetical protein
VYLRIVNTPPASAYVTWVKKYEKGEETKRGKSERIRMKEKAIRENGN